MSGYNLPDGCTQDGLDRWLEGDDGPDTECDEWDDDAPPHCAQEEKPDGLQS